MQAHLDFFLVLNTFLSSVLISASDLVHAEDPSCLGIFYGIVGKISLQSSEDRLLLVRESALVGNLPGDYPVYKIKSVTFLPLQEETSDLGLEQCR